ncbi:hypothetical protein [Enterococcus sp. AZ101]|uniref:hypothetical protein n=1 Tax=Enterococcus sp. AZ101 TaxID=2774742 RepID=UPI003D2A31CA
MLKKLSLKQFTESQLTNWDSAIRFGNTDKDKVQTFQFALYFLGSIFILFILLGPKKFDFNLGWIEYVSTVYTLLLFIYMAILLISNRNKNISPKIEIYNTLNMGLGTLWVVLFFFNGYIFMTKVLFAENTYKQWIFKYEDQFNLISNMLFLLLIITFFSGYFYDIIYRTKQDKLKKMTDTDKTEGNKLRGYASVGALIGLALSKVFISGDLFLSIFLLILSYFFMFFTPRTFIPTYLKIRFPEKYLTNRMENEH